ncbi:MAG: antibiotic biosynthesis monooxygenase [Alphaproteobacteria bacterium CG_4_10_14_0_2_um_filter_63_37]|nr:MAG: antibiotic biosynthesis monooxygenase [Proteobacteria bacterium CG1_02_64_396]PJA24583.1 MAG: antibiotic biosynthesis monooxygenase [Alphaproteobacteria bacterium CG_4_10_14_0_2_um_filter_63_37]
MIVVANRIPVAEGHEEAFVERFKTRAGEVERQPGFMRLEVLKPLQSDYHVVLTWWQDEASFKAWTESPAFAQAHARRPKPEMFAGPNQFEMHEIVILQEPSPSREVSQ